MAHLVIRKQLSLTVLKVTFFFLLLIYRDAIRIHERCPFLFFQGSFHFLPAWCRCTHNAAWNRLILVGVVRFDPPVFVVFVFVPLGRFGAFMNTDGRGPIVQPTTSNKSINRRVRLSVPSVTAKRVFLLVGDYSRTPSVVKQNCVEVPRHVVPWCACTDYSSCRRARPCTSGRWCERGKSGCPASSTLEIVGLTLLWSFMGRTEGSHASYRRNQWVGLTTKNRRQEEGPFALRAPCSLLQ